MRSSVHVGNIKLSNINITGESVGVCLEIFYFLALWLSKNFIAFVTSIPKL